MIANNAGSGMEKAPLITRKETLLETIKGSLEQISKSVDSSGVASPAVNYQAGEFQNEILFNSFQATTQGHWKGNMRKYCIFGPGCLYQEPTNSNAYGIENLNKNGRVKDIAPDKEKDEE